MNEQAVAKLPSDVLQRGEAYMRKLYSKSVTFRHNVNLFATNGKVFKTVCIICAHDPDRAVKQLLVAVSQLGTGSHNERVSLANACTDLLAMNDDLLVGYRYRDPWTIWSHEMTMSPKIIIYTDVLHCPEVFVHAIFRSHNHVVEVIQESEMHSSLFICYGGLDETYATSINGYLTSHGVKTWFFPNDALPGQKLHRAMSTGIMNYDRVLLICSKSSLERAGVLNELERVLEREAKEGGSDILIPVSIDDYVFSDWTPDREDISEQIRSRVITMIPNSDAATKDFQDAMTKLLTALKKNP